MSKSRAPRKIDNPELKRVIDDVYKELNFIKDSIGTVYNGAPSDSQGKIGDIAVYKDQFGKHILSIKTNNGWARIGMSIPKVVGEPFKGVGVDRDSINLESSDAINLKSRVSYKPQITIENQKNDGLPPYLTFKKTNADDDNFIGAIGFNSVNDASQDITYASILGQMTDITDGTEDGKLTFTTYKNGSNKSFVIDGGSVSIPEDLNVTGTITSTAGFTTTGTWTFDEYTSGTIEITSVQDSGTTFNDNDTSLMTAAAISNKIESYGYSTGTGVTSLIATANETTVSGATGNVTIGLPDDVTIGGDLTVTNDITVNGNNINYDAGHSYISVSANSGTDQGGHRLILQSGKGTGSASGGNIYFDVSDSGSSGSSVNMHTSQIGIGSGFLALKATGKLYFDGVHASGNTYIVESASDVLDVYVGGDKALSLDENTGYIDTHEDWTLRTGAPSHSSNRLKLLPSDFVASDGGRPVMIDDTGSDRWLESYGTLPMFACKEIPRGYKATVVRIEGSGTSSVTVYEATYTSKSVTSKGTGSIGSSIDITDVNSTDSNYLLIEMAQASGEEVYGGHIDIALIT